MVLADFHVQMNFLNLVWRYLYQVSALTSLLHRAKLPVAVGDGCSPTLASPTLLNNCDPLKNQQ